MARNHPAFVPPASQTLRSCELGGSAIQTIRVKVPSWRCPQSRRARYVRHELTTCTATEQGIDRESPEVREDLMLHKVELLAKSGSQPRIVRMKRRGTLGGVDVLDHGPADTPISVELAVVPVDSNFRVLGRTRTVLECECDRCLDRYNMKSKGTFEVWLTSFEGSLSPEQEREAEAIEDYSDPDAVVDLASHVHDAVLLSLPMKSLCKKDCPGITPRTSSPVQKNNKLAQPSAEDDTPVVRDSESTSRMVEPEAQVRSEASAKASNQTPQGASSESPNPKSTEDSGFGTSKASTEATLEQLLKLKEKLERKDG